MDAAITRTGVITVAAAEATERSAAKSTVGFLAWAVVLVGFVALVSGLMFLWQGYSANQLVTNKLVAEQVALSGSSGVVVSNAQQAQQQADTIHEHRTTRYGTYQDTGSSPADRATYVNALTLENSLGLAILAFGVAQMAMGSGGVMILMGIALLAIGLALRQLNQRIAYLSLA